MQRLKRLRDDRGAVAVWVAILMVPMLVVAALAIDIGAAHADRQRLQTGADAAALAVAQQCAAGACGDAEATAQELADANRPQGGPVTAEVLELNEAEGWVEVETTSDRDFWFAPVIGLEGTTQARSGAASWGAPSGGRSMVPFTFSACYLGLASRAGDPGHPRPAVLTFDSSGAVSGLNGAAVGSTVRLYQSQVSDTSCTNNSGNAVPGGFGWLQGNAALGDTRCEVTMEIGVPVRSGTGGSQASSCHDFMSDHTANGEVLLLPVFSDVVRASNGNPAGGNNAGYHLSGFIAATLDGYRFQGQTCFPVSFCSIAPNPGNGSGWLQLTIHRFVDLGATFDTDPDAPDLGAQIVQLRLPEGG